MGPRRRSPPFTKLPMSPCLSPERLASAAIWDEKDDEPRLAGCGPSISFYRGRGDVVGGAASIVPFVVPSRGCGVDGCHLPDPSEKDTRTLGPDCVLSRSRMVRIHLRVSIWRLIAMARWVSIPVPLGGRLARPAVSALGLPPRVARDGHLSKRQKGQAKAKDRRPAPPG